VRLAQRREPERSVVALVALAADAKERLADESNGCRRHGLARQLGTAHVSSDSPAHGGQIVAHPTHAVILAKLAALDRALMIAILAPPTSIEPPRLH